MALFINDFVNLYQNQSLEKLRIQYKDFTLWQSSFLQSEKLLNQEEFWLNQFSEEVTKEPIPVLNLPTDYQRTTKVSFAGDCYKFELNEELSKKLNLLAKREGATLFMVLLASYNILLSKYSGQEDIIVGTPIAGRSHPDLENLIGMFVNTLALRNHLQGSETIREFLNDVRKISLMAYENQDYQFESLIEKLKLNRDMTRNPLFDTTFSLDNINFSNIIIDKMILKPVEFENKTSKFDLTLNASEQDDVISFIFRYRTGLFKKETIVRMARHYVNIIKEIVASPEKQISTIQLLDENEKNQLLCEFNSSEKEYEKDKTVVHLFEEQVQIRANNIAVGFGNERLSYVELNAKANQLARVLRKKGVSRDNVVALIVDRSIEMMVGIMGIIKAGGAYLPIDPEYPEKRVQYLLEDSGVEIVLTSGCDLNGIEFDGEIINLNSLSCKEILFQEEATNLEIINNPDDLNYIIYTSGTTGKPKGVMIEHGSVINLVIGLYESIYQQHEGYLNIALLSPYVFDASVKQIFAAFLLGHALYITSDEVRRDGKLLLNFYQKNCIDISDGTPAHLSILLDSAQMNQESMPVKHFIIGGEALPAKVVTAFFARYKESKLQLTNIYVLRSVVLILLLIW